MKKEKQIAEECPCCEKIINYKMVCDDCIRRYMDFARNAGAKQERAKVKIVLKRLRKKWTEIHIKNKNKYISIPENLWDDLEESLLQKKSAKELK